MRCQAKRGISCLPVTALHCIEHRSETILFYNQGSSITIRLARNSRTFDFRQVFGLQQIHGISSSIHQSCSTVTEYHVVIWGGRLLCTGILTIDDTNCDGEGPELRFSVSRTEVFNDWLMTVTIEEQRQLVLLLTAHNALWRVSLVSNPSDPPVRLTNGMSTLLYSGAISIIDINRALISAGTIFGEVIVWICQTSEKLEGTTSYARHLFLGHRGSIFGVAVSGVLNHNGQNYRLLASCSDDRTVRIWDIYHCNEAEPSPTLARHFSMDTGFKVENDQGLELTVAWGHLSRIWGVYFIEAATDNDDEVRIVSRGEDGACQFWNVSLTQLLKSDGGESNGILRMIGMDRHHSGKNVWSLASASQQQQTTIYTGGADGQVVLRDFPRREQRTKASIEFANITESLQLPTKRSLKQYLVFPNGTITATTDHGEIVRMNINNTEGWSFIYQPSRKTNTLLCENQTDGLMFYCLANGTLRVYDVVRETSLDIVKLPCQATWMQISQFDYRPNESRRIHILANLYHGQAPEFLEIILRANETIASSQTIHLPIDFVVTASFYSPGHNLLICGSRAGALAVLNLTDIGSGPVDESSVIRHVHSSDTVTSITILSQPSKSRYLLTTGRDGSFAVHRLRLNEPGCKLFTLHRATPPFGPHIEGAFFRSTKTSDQALFLYGFRSKSFVMWNETDQTQILSVECGGAHRMWGFSAGQESSDVFVWTKAGTFNVVTASQSRHEILLEGGHGREIKALAISPTRDLPMTNETDRSGARLIATGAEDTDIRLLICTRASVEPVGVLKHHKTGLQALRFSVCGQYLFSSGGIEEFTIWRLTQIPIIGIGTAVLCNLTKTQEDEDARIMSFDVVEQISDALATRQFCITLAYSNGKIKILDFQHDEDSNHGQLMLLKTLVVGTLCLSQVRLLQRGNSLAVMIGATDGSLRYHELNSSDDQVLSHRVHQSNVATMSICGLGLHRHMVITGGDDNSLAITLLNTKDDIIAFKTLKVPKAHAAALTASSIVRLDQDNKHIYIITAGNDQRLCVWHVSNIASDDASREGELCLNSGSTSVVASLEQMHDCSLDVADISGLELLDYGKAEHGIRFEVLVVGVGMQSIRFEVQL